MVRVAPGIQHCDVTSNADAGSTVLLSWGELGPDTIDNRPSILRQHRRSPNSSMDHFARKLGRLRGRYNLCLRAARNDCNRCGREYWLLHRKVGFKGRSKRKG